MIKRKLFELWPALDRGRRVWKVQLMSGVIIYYSRSYAESGVATLREIYKKEKS
jgi:hypothetical protein